MNAALVCVDLLHAQTDMLQQVAINARNAAIRARSNIWRARTDKATTGSD